MNWRADVPYNDLPLLPPTQEVETVRVLKAAIEARAALAALDQAIRLKPAVWDACAGRERVTPDLFPLIRESVSRHAPFAIRVRSASGGASLRS